MFCSTFSFCVWISFSEDEVVGPHYRDKVKLQEEPNKDWDTAETKGNDAENEKDDVNSKEDICEDKPGLDISRVIFGSSMNKERIEDKVEDPKE